MVERGEVVLEGVSGGRLRARTGAVLTLHGVPLRALHNLGDEPALLVAVARHGPRPDDP